MALDNDTAPDQFVASEPLTWTPWKFLLPVAFVTLAFLALDFAFWFTADFRTFVPPCDGPFSERLYFASVTASGPFVMCVINRWSLGGWLNAIMLVGLCGALFMWGLVSSRKGGNRTASYMAIALWFFFGFCGTGLRIT